MNSRSWKRAIVLTATVALLSDCSAWHHKRLPGAFVATEKPKRVRVTHADGGRTAELTAPYLRQDSLAGPGAP